MDFEAFYQQQVGALLRVCWLVTLDAEPAADAAQEAMARAWARWAVLQDQQPAAWVRTVALNLCRSRWRRAQREIRLAPKTYVVTADPVLADPDLRDALRRLPVRQREAVVLHYWLDLTVDDCAEEMGVSAGSVKQHLRRARLALGADPSLTPVEERL